ncbi:MAG: hypothetical protein NWE79_01900 [Candidatus Bathyarchaeota archaeon]|nr:hypothetical protein [Candidatus Bathyarchaeota archaeon]
MVKKVKASLYISEDRREKIRRSGLSLEEYFNRLWEKHERFTMDKWNDGGFWINFYRVCFLRAETLNFIFDQFEEESLLKIGREVGERQRSTMEAGLVFNTDEDSRLKMIEFMVDHCGWGHFTWENESIIITMPIFAKPHFIKGYLEGIFNIKLALIESYPNRIVFKVAH